MNNQVILQFESKMLANAFIDSLLENEGDIIVGFGDTVRLAMDGKDYITTPHLTQENTIILYQDYIPQDEN
jgi:sulfur transfer complex TusBCD TusB component (DsrH family)